jgi:hypothetical protein
MASQSSVLRRKLISFYAANPYNISPLTVRPDLNISNNNVFNIFLKTDITGEQIDVPKTLTRGIVPILLQGIEEPERSEHRQISDVAFALFENARPVVLRTASSVFSGCLELPQGDRLMKIATSNGLYYGGKDFILDAQYNPLFLHTIHMEKTYENLIYKNIRVYVNPRVFTSTGLVEKGIIKTLIPLLTTTPFRIPSYPSGAVLNQVNIADTAKTEVLVTEDINKFIVKPVPPDPSTFDNADLNKFLVEHIGEVLRVSEIL